MYRAAHWLPSQQTAAAITPPAIWLNVVVLVSVVVVVAVVVSRRGRHFLGETTKPTTRRPLRKLVWLTTSLGAEHIRVQPPPAPPPAAIGVQQR